MVKVVYFNQWFSSIANVIDDLKNKHSNTIKLVASSRNENHAYKNSVDLFIHEDWEETDNYEESMNNYVNWVLNLCKTYKVDYFFVKKHAKAIMKRRTEFDELRIILISEDYDTLSIMDSKAGVYNILGEYTNIERIIPEFKTFSDGREAVNFLNSHRGKNDICLKFDTDEGGASFRAINDNEITLKSLYKYRVNTIKTSEAINLTADCGDDLHKLIFMELLDNPEISVDCYNSKKGFIAICRSKENNRVQRIFYNSYIASICKEIGAKLNLKFTYNVQFRFKKDSNTKDYNNLRLLEVNPRISGGLYYESFIGMNIAEICLLDLMNCTDAYNFDKFINFEDKFVTHVEKPLNI